MKTKLLALAALTLMNLSTAHATYCTIGDEDAYVEFKGNQVKIVMGIEDGKELVSISGPDLFFVEQGSNKLNLFAAHHNTAIHLASDSRIFPSSDSFGLGGWNGVLMLSQNLVKEGLPHITFVHCDQ